MLRYNAIFLILLNCGLLSSGYSIEADKTYLNGDYEKASSQYREALIEDTDDARLHFNLGASQYKEGDFEGAQSSISQALKTEDVGLQQKAFFNLGNTLYQLGKVPLEEQKFKEALEPWENALENFKLSSELNQADLDSKKNLEFMQSKIEWLKKMIEQQSQQKEEQEKDKDQDEKKDQEEDQEDQGDESNEEKSDQESGDSKEDQGSEQDSSKGDKEEDQEEGEKSDASDKGEKSKPKKDEMTKDLKAEEAEKKESLTPEEKADREAKEKESRERRMMGKMTRDEARRLLETLQSQEKKLPIGMLDKSELEAEVDGREGRNW